MSFQLLITTTKTRYHQIEVGYGTYRQGSLAAMASSTTTASFDTKEEADIAAKILEEDDTKDVVKLYR